MIPNCQKFHFKFNNVLSRDLWCQSCWAIDLYSGSLCRCSENLCCLVCIGEWGCLAASKDFDFILQHLLIGQPCTNYKGVKPVASQMVGLDDLPITSSESEFTASSGGEDVYCSMSDFQGGVSTISRQRKVYKTLVSSLPIQPFCNFNVQKCLGCQ